MSANETRWPTRRNALRAGASLALAALLAACGKARPKVQPVPAGSRVLALGDSLTFGTGADPGASYPDVLAELTGWTVVNGGVPGDTAAQALERLPALLRDHAPALVLVSIGGNDLLRRLPDGATKATVRRICEQALAAGAQVLLIGVPRPTLAARLTGVLDDHPMYAELAAELQVPLHLRGWADVLQDAALRADEIHANAAGYRRFAQALRDSAVAAGLR